MTNDLPASGQFYPTHITKKTKTGLNKFEMREMEQILLCEKKTI